MSAAGATSICGRRTGGAARRRRLASRTAATALVAAAAWWSSSCAPSGFASQSLVDSVRILGSSADEPYAKPGDTVHVSVLAFDGRSAGQRASSPLNLDWLPVTQTGELLPCVDPANDAYYACFSKLGSSSVLGAPGGAAADACPVDAAACEANLDAGVASPLVATTRFTMPADVVAAHPPVAGTSPYGLAFLFNMACAGRVAYAPLNPSNINPQQAPLDCVDDAGAALGPNDYVLGFARVYSRLAPDGGYYDNANPLISGVDLPPCTLAVQGSVPSFAASALSAVCTPSTCPNVTLGAVVPAASWEIDPLELDANGSPLHEEIWANYYSTFGGFTSETRLLYDPSSGAVADADTAFQPPALGPGDPHDGFIFIVVYDDRGGESWVSVPMHVCSDATDPACAASSCASSDASVE